MRRMSRVLRAIPVFAATTLVVTLGAPSASTSAAAKVAATTAPVSTPADTFAISDVTTGSYHSCLLRATAVLCSGLNDNGQLGTGTTAMSLTFQPSLLTGASLVDAGGMRTCATLVNKTLWCWGQLETAYETTAQIAPTTRAVAIRSAVLLPTQLPITGVVHVDVGASHTCAIKMNASLWCWGSNGRGQLGVGTRNDSIVPVDTKLRGVVAVSVGTTHTCAVTNDKRLWCWGANGTRQLGTSGVTARLKPERVGTLTVSSVSAGNGFTCVVASNAKASDDHKVLCFGRNNSGQLGLTKGKARPTPVNVRLTDPVSVHAGEEFACANIADGTVWCWGNNTYGQLADGTSTSQHVPHVVNIPEALGTTSLVSVGVTHACAVLSVQRGLWCWGRNLFGELGDSSAVTRREGTGVWPDGVHRQGVGTATSARVIAAGDVSCGDSQYVNSGTGAAGSQCGAPSTAGLVTSMSADAVLALGDLQYPDGEWENFDYYYRDTWGTFASKTFPMRGNHEYGVPGAYGYTRFFGPNSQSYYSTDFGPWRALVVDSWCLGQLFDGCSAISPQSLWLAAQLRKASTEGKCVVVAMHHPLVSSGRYGTVSVSDLWRIAVDGGADLMLAAHDHIYERFAPLGNDGRPRDGGPRFFISGLGGAPAHNYIAMAAGSEFRYRSNHGVLDLTFAERGYNWSFVNSLDATVVDTGSATCAP